MLRFGRRRSRRTLKLSRYIIDLYLSSPQGARLVEGFDALLGNAIEDPLPADDSTEGYSPRAFAWYLARGCFTVATEAVARTLRDAGEKAPDSPRAARELYLRLLEAGVKKREADRLAFIESTAWLRDEQAALEQADDGGAEESKQVGDDPEPDHELEGEPDPDDVDPETVLDQFGGGDAQTLRVWAAEIPSVSWALHALAPEYFAPYGFASYFHQFEAVCAEIGIPLPRPPGKADDAGRARYYLELNDALQEFRSTYELTPAEFDAFIYGFCLDQVPEDDCSAFPPAQRAWLLMAEPGVDFAQLDDVDEEARNYWQGHCDMRPGDICVMWYRSPLSCVGSIWRATSRGFADPFFYYYRTVWIGDFRRVEQVSFRELQSDPTWSMKPAIRAHFQNSSGKEITFDEYEALLHILERKGMDTAHLPRLMKRPAIVPEGVENERDVETSLLEPLLQKLGYSPKDWIRQYSLRMGRGERIYPDYVFGATGARGEESAKMLVEAKYRIAHDRDLREAYIQARSYAERLAVGVFVICALEGVWVFVRKSGRFDGERFTKLTWTEAHDAKRGRELDDLIGKRAILEGASRQSR